MRKFYGILFAIFMIFLFLEILIGFPISLEHEPFQLPNSSDEKSKTAENQKEANGSSTTQLETEQKMQGVHLVESRAGDRDWELFAESAENSQGKGAWQLQNVKVLFYNNDKVDFTVTGKRGNIDSGSKNMKIEGNVVTRSSNGYTFQSNSVSYFSTRRLIRSPEAIRMVGPADERGKGLILTGAEMEANVDSNVMTIKENVTASKQLNDGKKFQIQSGSAEFSGKNHSARFIDDVSIDVGSIKMQGPEAQFDYRGEVDILQSVTVKGGVKVSDVDKFATSDTVKFDPEQNKFIFNGRPRVVQNNDEITGEQIVFIDGGKKVKVEKIRAKVEKQ
ncbi:MAG: LPS export ABC transporter periplasmic protein LptC [Pseudobdellovibrionaceae bacterium]